MKKSYLLWITAVVVVLSLGALGASALAQTNNDTGPGLIVFASDRSGNSEIYSLDPNTGQIQQLTNDPGSDIDPQWSPDGTQIVFASDRDGDYDLYVMQPDGSEVKQVTNNDQSDVLPRWQPNGTYVVYVSDVNQQWDLYAVNVDTGLVRQLTNDKADERSPLISKGDGGAQQPGVPTVVPTVMATAQPDGVVNSERLNVRANPGQGAQLLTTVLINTPLRIIGRYSDNTWLQVITPDNVTGWVFGAYVTININLANIPVVNATFIAPPTAVPTAVPTAAGPTAVPASNTAVNLVGGVIVFDPQQPVCGQTFVVGFDVANLGSQASAASGLISLVDTRTADGTQQGTTTGGFPILQPGQTFRVTMPLTISTWYNDQHTITLIIDPAGQIPDNNRGDNTRTVNYTLQKGNCP